MNEFSGLYKSKEPTKGRVAFVISNFANPTFIDTNSEDIGFYVNEFGLTDMEDLIDDASTLPKIAGLYTADIFFKSSVSQSYEYPSEYEMSIWLENVKRIEVSYE